MSIGIAGIMVFLSFISVMYASAKEKVAVLLQKQLKTAADQRSHEAAKMEAEAQSYGGPGNDARHRPRDNYSQNFV
ncbi:hypothetical protein PF005_g10648 [Phytophthora fragariae]|nr:hypothetical protein PF003_g2057 [Phytophthora fragariae]KAE8947486.1 hypothetical protein PF009_g2923 [Phytophthora fragariae]KAE9071481.1 hypothetical protein PF006_g29139 [Phytophthora fragariae]KAE9080003.1 hypothetical protein PF010_g22549 [Phytophthora fragariae]KAE9091682.1 hypothetical protein PF007_g18782 [Phytophthora fragariae]